MPDIQAQVQGAGTGLGYKSRVQGIDTGYPYQAPAISVTD